MTDFQGTDYIDALRFETAHVRYHEATRLIVGPNALVKAGTDEYYELARMRTQAKRELMDFAPRVFQDTFGKERAELASSGYRG